MINVSARIIPSPMVSPLMEQKEFIPVAHPQSVDSSEVVVASVDQSSPIQENNPVTQSPIAETIEVRINKFIPFRFGV
jgi:hypothetical protein